MGGQRDCCTIYSSQRVFNSMYWGIWLGIRIALCPLEDNGICLLLYAVWCLCHVCVIFDCISVTKLSCSPQCDGRCFGPLPNQCCHSECAAGCTGRTKSTCWVCKTDFIVHDITCDTVDLIYKKPHFVNLVSLLLCLKQGHKIIKWNSLVCTAEMLFIGHNCIKLSG